MSTRKQPVYLYRCQYGDTLASSKPLRACPRCKKHKRSASLKRIHKDDFPRAKSLLERYISKSLGK